MLWHHICVGAATRERQHLFSRPVDRRRACSLSNALFKQLDAEGVGQDLSTTIHLNLQRHSHEQQPRRLLPDLTQLGGERER